MAFIQLVPPVYYNIVQYGADPTGATDSTLAIAAAISAASGLRNGTVYCPPGLYIVSSDLAVPSNVSILGSGRATIFQAANSSQPNIFNLSSSSHITISDLQINGNKSGVTVLGTQYTHENGIYMRGSDDITISRCYIHDCMVSGIMADGGSTNIMVSNCRMVNNYDNQIYIRAQDTSPYTPCDYITVTGCICSGGSFSGIQILGSSYFSITGNTCYSNGPTSAQGDGIGSEGASYGTIAGNTCYNNGIQGINIRFTSETGGSQSSSHIVVSGNTCYNHTSTNGDAGGISIGDTDDIQVTGNLCYGNGFGININGGNGNGVQHCHLVGNSVRGNSNTGLRISPGTGSVDFLLENNYLADNAGDNLYATVPVIIIGGASLRAAASKEGIHLSTGAGGSFLRNVVVADNGDNGVLIDSTCGAVNIRECHFDNFTTSSQKRAVQEQSGGGPTLMFDCRILNQANNLYTFNNSGSRYYDPQTKGTVTVTGSYTLLAQDEVVLCNQSAAMTLTIPSGILANGRILTVKDISGNAFAHPIMLSPASGNIDGLSSRTLSINYGVIRLISDGTNWYVLDLTPTPPIALYSDQGIATTSSQGAGATNTVYFVLLPPLQAQVVASAMRVRFSSGGAGNYDLGIYDSTGANGKPGNLLGHCASTATSLASSSATLSPALLANVTLPPGVYWLAFWISDTTDTWNKQSISGNMAPVMSGTITAGPLPANASSVTGLGNASVMPIIEALLNNEWS